MSKIILYIRRFKLKMNNEYIEADIRAAETLQDLKECMLDLLDEMPEYFDSPSSSEHELLFERVSNIESCLMDNADTNKINIDNLRC